MKKSLHLRLRDEGISFRGTTLIDMLFRLLILLAVCLMPLPDGRITYPLKGLLLPGETFSFVYSLAPADCSL